MIEISNLTYHYGAFSLFDGLSVHFLPGRIYGFLGKNGAGKTSLFKIMAGLLAPQQGESRVMGFSSRARSPGMLENLFYIPESFHLPPLSIGQYETLYGGFYTKFSPREFGQLLTELDLDRGRHLTRLSYGLRKRFLLAFALATHCEIVLLDEPTNGLDIPSKRIFRKMVASAATERRTFIIATHQIKEVETIFDSLVFIDKGKILLNSSVENIAKKLTFSTTSSVDDTSNGLYSEETVNGYATISPNESGNEGSVDIEFLFNAITNDPETLLNILAQPDGGESSPSPSILTHRDAPPDKE